MRLLNRSEFFDADTTALTPVTGLRSIKFLTALPLLFLAMLSVVFPNSMQSLTAFFLFICFLLSLLPLKMWPLKNGALALFGASFIVTLFYILLGVIKGAPLVAVKQVIAIYMVFPFIWFCIFSALFRLYGMERVVVVFVALAFACCASVAVYFYLYFNFGPQSVSFFKDNPNIQVADGQSAAIMHVYASLIFLSGAFFAAPAVVSNVWFRWALLVSLFLAAISSGRAALILSVPLGLIVGWTFSHKSAFLSKKLIVNSLVLIGVFAASFYVAATYWGIELFTTFERLFDKISEGGGVVRTDQVAALMEGASSDYFLGAGHGIGVDYIRSYRFPWRYESVWFATLYRVGFFGSFIYLLPFIFYITYMMKKRLAGLVTISDRFMFGGFVCAFVASNTNPYIEAFSLQWMYVMPIAYFFYIRNFTVNRI